VHRDIFLQYKPRRCTVSQIYFYEVLYMFRTDILPIIRSLNTVYKAIYICHTEILKVGKINSVYTYTYAVPKRR